jgi:hypothetical protein
MTELVIDRLSKVNSVNFDFGNESLQEKYNKVNLCLQGKYTNLNPDFNDLLVLAKEIEIEEKKKSEEREGNNPLIDNVSKLYVDIFIPRFSRDNEDGVCVVMESFYRRGKILKVCPIGQVEANSDQLMTQEIEIDELAQQFDWNEKEGKFTFRNSPSSDHELSDEKVFTIQYSSGDIEHAVLIDRLTLRKAESVLEYELFRGKKKSNQIATLKVDSHLQAASFNLKATFKLPEGEKRLKTFSFFISFIYHLTVHLAFIPLNFKNGLKEYYMMLKSETESALEKSKKSDQEILFLQENTKNRLSEILMKKLYYVGYISQVLQIIVFGILMTNTMNMKKVMIWDSGKFMFSPLDFLSRKYYELELLSKKVKERTIRYDNVKLLLHDYNVREIKNLFSKYKDDDKSDESDNILNIICELLKIISQLLELLGNDNIRFLESVMNIYINKYKLSIILVSKFNNELNIQKVTLDKIKNTCPQDEKINTILESLEILDNSHVMQIEMLEAIIDSLILKNLEDIERKNELEGGEYNEIIVKIMRSYDYNLGDVLFEIWIYSCKFLSLLLNLILGIPIAIYKILKMIINLIFSNENNESKLTELKKSLPKMFPIEFKKFNESLLKEQRLAFIKRKQYNKLGGSVLGLGALAASGAYLADSLGVNVGKVATEAGDKLDLYGGANFKRINKKKTKRKKFSKKKKKSLKRKSIRKNKYTKKKRSNKYKY